MEKITKEQRSRIMSAIRSKGTKIETLLAKKLWARGWRYRKNNRSVAGSPDITFKKYKVAVFCDGDFWHGKNWEEKKRKIGTNRGYWIPKIEKNMARDVKNNEALKAAGWIVLRFWEGDVHKNMNRCIEAIEKALGERGVVSQQ